MQEVVSASHSSAVVAAGRSTPEARKAAWRTGIAGEIRQVAVLAKGTFKYALVVAEIVGHSMPGLATVTHRCTSASGADHIAGRTLFSQRIAVLPWVACE